MKWRVKNTKTGNFVTIPTSYEAAQRSRNGMIDMKGNHYEVVSLSEETEKLSPKQKPMSDDVKLAISYLEKINYAPQTNHSTFANIMIARAKEKQLEISEKEEAYLWYVIYRYRRQIESAKLIYAAKQNKVY